MCENGICCCVLSRTEKERKKNNNKSSSSTIQYHTLNIAICLLGVDWIAEMLPNWEDMSNCDKIRLALLWLVVFIFNQTRRSHKRIHNLRANKIKKSSCNVCRTSYAVHNLCATQNGWFITIPLSKENRNENNKNGEETELKSDLYSHVVFRESYTGARKFAHYWNYLAILYALLFDLLRFCDGDTHANALIHLLKTKSGRKKIPRRIFFSSLLCSTCDRYYLEN